MTEKEQLITITVDGGYQPATVTLKQGIPATLIFKRISDVGCLNQVILPGSDDKHDLPLNTAQAFAIDTTHAGTTEFSCGMRMVHGQVVIQP
ncbi:cupredoxin domain-containing protein [Lactobacillus sp. CBA3606]|uniref:cupredoxin domain-containing protein n=1 Tax=Lactobacillus sp. CBA3606 TaxID=2099789 RepID=UPI001F2C270A|nr:cupredoxin domain-containing protein [Lactobacillus sp. CBA3606]